MNTLPLDSASVKSPDGLAGLRPLSQFDLLASERQQTFDGKLEPVLAVEPALELPAASASEAQANLFDYPQPELPFHALENGQIPDACLRGYRVKSDAHALDGGEVRVLPECCGRQNCECSRDGNDAERSRDLWNGTKRKGSDRKRVGMRHVAGEAPWGVLVVTLALSLRPSKKNAKQALKRWERACVRALESFLRKRTGLSDALFYVRANIHPCGEDAKQWHPHLNFQLPAWAWVPSLGKAKRFKPFFDVGELREAMHGATVKAFGKAAEGEAANCHWKYEQDETGKRHQAGYVPRTFPEWAHLKLRPAAYGLAHPSKRAELVEALDGLSMKPLPEWVSTPLRDGLEPAPISGKGATAEEAHEDHARQLAAHRWSCPDCRPVYPEHRRTTAGSGRVGGPAPLGQGPPGPSPANRKRWDAFLALPG